MSEREKELPASESRPPPYTVKMALASSMVCGLGCCIHGVHSCYMDKPRKGFVQFLTCGGCCVWSISDWVNMKEIVMDANVRSGWYPNQPLPSKVAPPTASSMQA